MPVFFLDADLPVPFHSQSKPLFTKIINLRVLEIVATARSSNYQQVTIGICLAELSDMFLITSLLKRGL
jgi:hypothetical protein